MVSSGLDSETGDNQTLSYSMQKFFCEFLDLYQKPTLHALRFQVPVLSSVHFLLIMSDLCRQIITMFHRVYRQLIKKLVLWPSNCKEDLPLWNRRYGAGILLQQPMQSSTNFFYQFIAILMQNHILFFRVFPSNAKQ